MALVILPCDLPHWCNLQKQLSFLSTVDNETLFIEGMFKIHNLCNISTGLDPDEPEKSDPNMFSSLKSFLANLSNEEKVNFYKKILPIMTRRALDLKALKPISGFHFSLQQQGDEMIYKRSFLASLLAHSFFSTFPKRTSKTHPTLQDFNFTFFFKFLDQGYQQAKLKSIFYYFELLESVIDENECVTYSRQIMPGKQWLTINDWMESCLPLCPLTVRNDGSLSDVEPQCLRICFSSPKIGGSVLGGGISQESVEFCTIPELICILASVEALEDNEVLLIKDAYQVSQIKAPKEKATLEKLSKPIRVCLCCMDAEDYAIMPLSQLEEDNVLRELNKALLGFRQGKTCGPKYKMSSKAPILRRLSPIGESFNSTPRENYLSKDETPLSVSTSANLGSPETKNCWLKLPTSSRRSSGIGVDGRRGRFIVLGSSGECLPVNRSIKADEFENMRVGNTEKQTVNHDTFFSLAQSEDDEEEIFHSARTSIDNESDDPRQDGNNEENFQSNSTNLNSSFDDEILSFTERLREALLRGAKTYNTKTDDSSYAVDISVSGSADEDNNVRCKRGTSTGFILEDESLDDVFYRDSSQKECNWGRNQSDKYSFTTDESDLDAYDHFTKWINSSDRGLGDSVTRKEAISDFASTFLKRAFSDTCAAVGESSQDKNRAIILARSFSLELAKQNPKLAAQLVNLLSGKDLALKSILPNKNGQRPVGTGNWGCGSCGGDPQIKLTIQWLAASYTGLPNLIYYTYRHQKLVKLDTVRRVLIDRGWTVGQLATSLLQFAHTSLNESHSTTLFDSLITSLHS